MSSRWRAVAVAAGLLALAVLLARAFTLGMLVSQARALQLPPPTGALFLPPLPRAWLAGHSVFGTVELVDPQARTITVRGEGGVRALVLLADGTLLERRGQAIDLSVVRAEEHIVAIGAPDAEGRLVARAVRVLGPHPGRPAPLWSAALRVAGRIYRFIDLTLCGLYWRRGS